MVIAIEAGVVLLALLGACGMLQVEAATVCLLKLKIDPKQSGFSGSGTTQAPIEGKVSGSKLNATGHVWLRVPSTSSCPPKFTAANADDLLQQSSLETPIGASSITFNPKDIKNKAIANDPDAAPLANMDFLGMDMGLTGTEPLGPGTVTVGKGTVAEAKAAAQRVCSQLILLNGTLDLSSKMLGPRTADTKHVAYNRTIAAGVGVTKEGEGVSEATLFLSNVTLLLNISPETKDGGGIPGVEFTRAIYTLNGDVVARADLRKAANWQEVDSSKVAWATVRRKDAPVVIGSNRPGKPRFIGENSTIAQECKPTRVLEASGLGTAASDSGKKSAAGTAAAGLLQSVAAACLAVLAAGAVWC